MLKSFTAFALEGFPMVNEGDDLARIIVETTEKNGLKIQDCDVIVIAQKIFSKAERRIVNILDVKPSRRAISLAKKVKKNAKFVELVLKETKRVLKASSETLLVEDIRGLICINAGIDKSNVEGSDNFALLPLNPDKSTEECRSEIKRLTGKDVVVIMCDTYSRPFRRGQVNFAIGIAGISPFRDYRGKPDLFGQILKVKNIAVVDEIVAAAELLMGQGDEARPVVMLRGLDESAIFGERTRVEELYISRSEDLFRNTV